MQLVQPTTPAQFFHLLRRQVLRPYRKPLVVFTPKSLLRHPNSVSALDELASGGFQAVLAETGCEREEITRLVMCSGRVYFDLLRRREELGLGHVALLRIEQLYPIPDVELQTELATYPALREIVWAQDEPQNQGAWRYMAYHLRQVSSLPMHYAGRPESASPATGFASMHKEQLEGLLQSALGPISMEVA